MYLKISNPMDYHVGLYIRLSKEDENEGQSESVTNQLSMLTAFAEEHRLRVYDTYIEIIVPYMIRLRFRDFVKECKNLLIYRLSHTEGCAEVLFFACR